MKLRKSEFARLMEARKEGRVASMTRILSYEDTPIAKRLGNYFRKQMPDYEGIYEEEEGDEVLYAINQYMEKYGINHRPLGLLAPGAESYLLPITENLELVVHVTDDYTGGGENEWYVQIDSFIVNDNATEKDVDQLIGVLKVIRVREG
jgi:hypothetical protein